MNHDKLVDELWRLNDLYVDVDPDVAAVLGVLVRMKVAGGSNARLATLALEFEQSELALLEGLNRSSDAISGLTASYTCG
jgi:hypothetical protein